MRYHFDIIEEKLTEADSLKALALRQLTEKEYEHLPKFTELRYLHIGFCQVQPHCVSEMVHLENLEIAMWCMDRVEIDTSRLIQLKEFSIAEGSESVDYHNLDFSNNPLLTELMVGDLDLLELPKGIDTLKSLKELELDGNRLKHIDIELPSTLKRLNIQTNQITHLPKQWAGLTQLEQAFINYNPVEDVSVFKNCKMLKLLNLTETKVSESHSAEMKQALPGCEVIL